MVLQDEQFTSLFKNEDFEVDENSFECRALHPLAATVQKSLVKEHFEPFMEDEGQSDADASEEYQSSDDDPTNDKSKDGKKTRAPGFYEVKDERHAEAYGNHRCQRGCSTLEERIKALSNNRNSNGFNKVKAGPGGSREMTISVKKEEAYTHWG